MAVLVKTKFVFTEDEFETLEFEEMCDVLEKMYKLSGYDIEQLSAHFEVVNTCSDNSLEEDDE